MTITVKRINCPLCLEDTEIRRSNHWTRSPRYLRQTNRSAFLRYNSRGRTDTYFNDGHDCKGEISE